MLARHAPAGGARNGEAAGGAALPAGAGRGRGADHFANRMMVIGGGTFEERNPLFRKGRGVVEDLGPRLEFRRLLGLGEREWKAYGPPPPERDPKPDSDPCPSGQFLGDQIGEGFCEGGGDGHRGDDDGQGFSARSVRPDS